MSHIVDYVELVAASAAQNSLPFLLRGTRRQVPWLLGSSVDFVRLQIIFLQVCDCELSCRFHNNTVPSFLTTLLAPENLFFSGWSPLCFQIFNPERVLPEKNIRFLRNYQPLYISLIIYFCDGKNENFHTSPLPDINRSYCGRIIRIFFLSGKLIHKLDR